MNYNYVVIMMQFSHFLLIKDIWDLPLKSFPLRERMHFSLQVNRIPPRDGFLRNRLPRRGAIASALLPTALSTASTECDLLPLASEIRNQSNPGHLLSVLTGLSRP